MIIAGPGTGKTRTLAYRIAAAVTERGVRPDRCLAITFTRRAAQELADRVAALLPRRRRQPVITTFHGLGLLILRECHARAGLSAGFGVAGEETVRAMATEVAGSERAGASLLAAGDPQQRERLRAALADRDLVDFDGLLDLPVALLREDPELAERHRQRWQQICVDEYQDVDARQYELLRLLAGDGRGLTAIGDPDQAIYGFRGADVGFFLSFGRDYPGAATVQLTRNYRSAPAIVASALQAVGPATLVPGRALHPVRPAGRELPDRITLHQAADEEAEGAWIAETIDRLLGGASFHSLDTRRADGHGVSGLALAGIAVLYRTDAQAAALGQALTRAGLPFQKRSHDRLARRTAVRDIVRELSLTAPAGGNGAAQEEGPAGGNGAAGEEGPAGSDGAAGGEGPAGSAGGDGAVVTRLRAAVRRLTDQAPLRGLAPVDVLAAGEVLAPLARRCGSDLDGFLTEIALGAEADSLDPRADAITLLTLHAAKGLEFDVVFLAGCERGLLPLRLPGAGPGEPAGLAEERRLLFVGMTRARSHLFLSCAAQRTRHGATLAGGPSPFLGAIDPGLIDRAVPARPRRQAARQLRLL
ncbi:MAG: ATP-dependent helicase [Actinobacteria bacterium]|nr:ATP-dependent helicase [Actinomycetota bacterium]